VYPVIMKCWN